MYDQLSQSTAQSLIASMQGRQQPFHLYDTIEDVYFKAAKLAAQERGLTTEAYVRERLYSCQHRMVNNSIMQQAIQGERSSSRGRHDAQEPPDRNSGGGRANNSPDQKFPPNIEPIFARTGYIKEDYSIGELCSFSIFSRISVESKEEPPISPHPSPKKTSLKYFGERVRASIKDERRNVANITNVSSPARQFKGVQVLSQPGKVNSSPGHSPYLMALESAREREHQMSPVNKLDLSGSGQSLLLSGSPAQEPSIRPQAFRFSYQSPN